MRLFYVRLQAESVLFWFGINTNIKHFYWTFKKTIFLTYKDPLKHVGSRHTLEKSQWAAAAANETYNRIILIKVFVKSFFSLKKASPF